MRDESERLLHQRLARGIAMGVSGEEDYGPVFMTYHISGPGSVHTQWPADEPWMDFNTVQSGHRVEWSENLLEACYLAQEKPVLDFEPYYGIDASTVDLVRTIVYWGVFAGGFGTSYGHWSVWHFPHRALWAELARPKNRFREVAALYAHAPFGPARL